MEDLDPITSSRTWAARQLDDLAELGMRSDVDVVHQSDRFEYYRDAIRRLDDQGQVYRCYCTRREIRDAASAPQQRGLGDGLPEGAYPGTCRSLTRSDVRAFERQGRTGALRLRTEGERYSFVDRVMGHVEGIVDDVVLQRNDGIPAYNLAVVVDDHLQGVTEVVRGDDLASSTPRQLHLQQHLGIVAPAYAHVPLVVGPDGHRLAKRHGDVTLQALGARGIAPRGLLTRLAAELGVADPSVDIDGIAAQFSFEHVLRPPWVFSIDELGDDLGDEPALPR